MQASSSRQTMTPTNTDQPADAPPVLSPVLEDVHQSIPDLARRAEWARVVAVRPHPAAPTEHAVHRLREPDGQTLKAARKGQRTLRLHQKMDVVALDAELQNPEAPPRSPRQALAKHGEHHGSPQGRQHRLGAESHVRGVTRIVGRPPPVRHPHPVARGLPPRAGAAPAPGPRTQLEL